MAVPLTAVLFDIFLPVIIYRNCINFQMIVLTRTKVMTLSLFYQNSRLKARFSYIRNWKMAVTLHYFYSCLFS